ncbi:MAG: hypothetical protein ACRD1X_13850, partial [Vicinamibacteria bacterium]
LGDTAERKEMFQDGGTGFTGIAAPSGAIIAGPLPDNEEGFAYADLDLTEGIKWKLYHDYSGNYNRFDLLSLNVNRDVRSPLREVRAFPASAVMVDHIAEQMNECLKQVADESLRMELQRLLHSIVSG